MKHFSKLTLVLFLFVFHFVASSQDRPKESFDKEKMDLLFSTIEENDKAMGSISIFQNGEEVYQNSFGYADVENNIPATAKTIYRIGSISKTYTAAIIMQLVDENKLTLDTKLETYFPEIPNAKKITIEHLLRHRSGLFDYLNTEDFNDWMEKPKSQSELIRIFVDNGVVFSPDKKYEYSNTNYVLLAFIAEKIESKVFSEIIKQRISLPLELNSTYYGGKINTADNEALSYKKMKSWRPSTEIDMSIPMGAGGVVSTAAQVNLFYNALFDGKVVSERSLKKMKKMGIGLSQAKPFGKEAFWFIGAIDGFSSIVIYFPADKLSFSLTFNALAMKMGYISDGVLSVFFGKEYKFPDFKPALELSSTDLDIYLGIYGSPELPFKITISKEDDMLIAEAPGVGALPLEAYEIDKFKSDVEGVQFHFLSTEKKLIFNMGGDHILTKEE